MDHGTDLTTAARRHAGLVALTVLLALGAALAYGLLRSPQYTAEARVTVGQISVATQGIPGFVTAASGLASAYSRAVDAPPVVRRAAAAAAVPEGEARDAVSASPIPDAPLFRVEAESDARGRAIALANGAAEGVIDYVRLVNRRADVRQGIRSRYGRVSRDVQRLRLARDAARRSFDRRETADTRERLQAATGRYDTARLEQEALRNVYGSAIQGASAANLLQLLAPATEAESDRRSVLERLLLTGLLGGLVLGLALAMLREGRRRPGAPPAG
jgi:hypothetical protein